VQYASSSALNLEELADKTNRINNGSIPVGGTGIKIRTRQPQQQPISNNFGSLGTAPRRIRLQMKISLGSVCSSEVTDANSEKEDDEVQSHVRVLEECLFFFFNYYFLFFQERIVELGLYTICLLLTFLILIN
jgi:hypothetical protein